MQKKRKYDVNHFCLHFPVQNQWERLMSHAKDRSEQMSDLLVRLGQYDKLSADLMRFVREGRELLERERPVGDSAARLQEQMETCQVGPT